QCAGLHGVPAPGPSPAAPSRQASSAPPPPPGRPGEAGRAPATQRQGAPVAPSRPGLPEGNEPHRPASAGPPNNIRPAAEQDQRSGPPSRAAWQGRQPGNQTPQWGGRGQRPVQEPQQRTG